MAQARKFTDRRAANQTAKATEEISGKIKTAQKGTTDAVEALEHISAVIGQTYGIANTIAVAVEERTSTTAEISRNVSEAASGGTEIAKNILDVANAAKNTAQGVMESQKVSSDLSRTAQELNTIVGQFRINADNGRGGKPKRQSELAMAARPAPELAINR